MHSWILLLLVGTPLLWPAVPSAEPRKREALAGGELELARTVSRHLFAVQREERRASDRPALRDLLSELRGLHDAVEPEPVLAASPELGTSGRSWKWAKRFGERARARRAADARAARRARIESQVARVRERADALETELSTLRTKKLRGQAERAIGKARQLSDEAMRIRGELGPRNRANARALRRRLRPEREVQAKTVLAVDEDPTFRSMTAHRRFWAARP